MKKNLKCWMLNFLLILLLPFAPAFLMQAEHGSAFQEHAMQSGNGVWMHVDTFMNEPDIVLQQYADALVRSEIKTVFILAKKIDGSVNFPSPHALKRSFSGDPMKRLIEILKSRHIKVFFYFPINTDPAWNSAHPQDIAWQMGNPAEKRPLQDPSKRLVNLTSTAYRDYILKLALDALNRYPLDGIQLDYIRYRNGHWGFSQTENTMARQRGINIERVKELSYQTFVQPGDWRTLLQQYDANDKDVVSWVRMREDIVFNFASHIGHQIRNKGKEFSITLVHAGALGNAYGAVHFSQSYERLSSVADIAVPMAYHGSIENVEEFVHSIIKGAKKRIAPGCTLMIGLQAYETSTHRMNQAISTAKKHNINFVLFRVGTFSFVHLDYEMLHPEQIQINADVFHGIPYQQVYGMEIRGLGGWLKANTDEWRFQQAHYVDGFKIWGETFFTRMGQQSFLFPMDLKVPDLQGFFMPFVVLADQKKDLPTFTTSSLQIYHYQICPSSGRLHDTINPSQKMRLQLHRGITFIHVDELSLWGIAAHYDELNNELTLSKGFRQLTFNYSKETLNVLFLPDTKPMEYPKELKLGVFSWVPLRLTFEMMGYFVHYAVDQKMIHLLKAERTSNEILPATIHNWSDEAWFWKSSDLCVFLMEDFLKTDFYQLTSWVHQKGRKVVLSIHPSWSHSSHGETLYWMMQMDVPRWYQPDQLEWRTK